MMCGSRLISSPKVNSKLACSTLLAVGVSALIGFFCMNGYSQCEFLIYSCSLLQGRVGCPDIVDPIVEGNAERRLFSRKR